MLLNVESGWPRIRSYLCLTKEWMTPGLVALTGNKVLVGSRGLATLLWSGSPPDSCVYQARYGIGVSCPTHRRQWSGHWLLMWSPRWPAFPPYCPKTWILFTALSTLVPFSHDDASWKLSLAPLSSGCWLCLASSCWPGGCLPTSCQYAGTVFLCLSLGLPF